MNQYTADVVSVSEPLPGLKRAAARSVEKSFIITLACPEIAREARPGQFVMVNCGTEHTLPRPFSINRVVGDTVMLFIAVLENGQGTEWLFERKPGEQVKILGPVGNGFDLDNNLHNVLLIAGGMGIAPLVYLAETACTQGIQVDLLYGAPNRNRYPVETVLQDISFEIATEDGSEGYQGVITDLVPKYIDSADKVFICGPSGMYGFISNNRQSLLKDKPVQVSLESRMACGRGICYGCTIQTKQGLRRVCEHGPVFDIDDLVFQE